MTSAQSWTSRAAAVFYEWLVVRGNTQLPLLGDICGQLLPDIIDPYRLARAIQWLAKQDMIDVNHGRGHYIIRVRSPGRIYRTAGCPLELSDLAVA